MAEKKKVVQNLALLSCRSPFLDDDKVYPPLANLYLYNAVKRDSPYVNIDVMDDYSIEDPSWLDKYDAIGLSIMTPQREDANKLLHFVKDNRPDITMIGGGPHAKYYLGEMIQEPWDFIFTHDGEKSLPLVLNGQLPKLTRNVARVISDDLRGTEFKKFAVKPARLENEAFLRTYNYKLGDRDSTTMLTARGCPEKCTFCEDAETLVRWTPEEMVMSEIDDIAQMGYSGVYIFDDIFALAMKKVQPICESLKKKDIIYRCNGQARVLQISPDFAKMLGGTGCHEIAFGAESGHQKILDNIMKRTTVEMNYDFVKKCKEEDIIVKAFLMLGLPGEDLETIAATEDFIRDSGIDDFQMAVYYPYKGTKIRDALDRGDATLDIAFMGEGLGAYGQKGGTTEAVIRTKALSRDDLLYHRDRLVNKYHPESHEGMWIDDKPKPTFFDTHLNVDDIDGRKT